MSDILSWWLLIELIGIAVLPVAFRFFRNLPDRGYAFIKPLGLLLIAYPFWLLTTLGFLTNTRGAIALVAVIVGALSWWFAKRPQTDDGRPMTYDEHLSSVLRPPSFIEWLRANSSLILTTELVFTVAFSGWAFVRAYMPEITATEKPMEFAFLNGVLQSEHFPPRDPWLAGYAISYYYFGYIIVAMLTSLSGVAPSVAFNLAIALLFALSATGAFGLAYDLSRQSSVVSRQSTVGFPVSDFQHLFFALFAPLFLLLIGNLEGLFESLHAKGLGTPEFWKWLDVKGLAQAPPSGSFAPNDNWWWWRASRVVHDVVNGQTQEVIDEFPQFSFLLGDMHPHVLALPFVLLALAAALNLLNSKFQIPNSKFDLRQLLTFHFLLLPLILGGLFFLNSWDILPYGFSLVAAFAISGYRARGAWDAAVSRDLAIFVVALGALSVALYLPFYIGFQSQAGGILPTLFVKTRLHQYLIMFGLFIFILGAFVLRLMREQRVGAREWFARAAPLLGALVALPFAVALLAVVILSLTPALQDQVRAALPGAGSSVLTNSLAAYFRPLLSDPWLTVLLLLLLGTLVVLLRKLEPDDSTTFVLLIAFTGFLLTYGVEFVYLRDQFGTRMNTVFKFYFQTWTLLSIAATYAVFYLARAFSSIARGAWFIALGALVLAGLIYPALAIPNRADDFKKTPTLDGIAWIAQSHPGDYYAIQWLRENAPRGAHIVEAVGDAYSYGNRISSATGLPTVLGWFNHENQWRGSTRLFKDDAAGIDRAADVARLYQTLDPAETLTYLDRYAIRFVIVGQIERAQYGLTRPQIDKFGRVMKLVHENGDTRIYAR
jgi:YYY domain-containing protein